METLPPEMLLYIFESVGSIKYLLPLRQVSQKIRDLVDQSGTHIGFALARSQFHAFDDALLAMRLRCIPHVECCHFDLQANAYSFLPTQGFFQSVMEDKPSPQGSPFIPPVS